MRLDGVYVFIWFIDAMVIIVVREIDNILMFDVYNTDR
jgi:hypothetical protein